MFAQQAQSLGFDLQLCINLVANICDRITQEVKAEGSEINSYLWLHSKFEAGLGYMRPSLKNQPAKQTKVGCLAIIKSQKHLHSLHFKAK